MDRVSGLLKAFVIVAGVVLVVGTLLLAALILLRVTGADWDRPGRLVTRVYEVALPEGLRIEQVTADGDRAVLLGVDPDGVQFLTVIDVVTGERLSLVRLQAGPPAAP